MRADQIQGLTEAYSKVHATPEVLSEEIEQLDEKPGGPARFWDSNMGKFVTKVSNAAKSAGEYLAPSPERSAEPSVRAGVRTPQTGFSHVASMDRTSTSTAKPTRRETPAQREARISRAQDAAIAAADKAEKAKAEKAKAEKAKADAERKPESNRPGPGGPPPGGSPSGSPGGTPSNVISAKNIAGQSQKVTIGRKYGATLGGQKGSVTYDSSGKRTFVADKPSTAAEKPTSTPATKPSAMDQWAKANPKLAKNVTPSGTQKGTGQSQMSKDAAELRDMQKASQIRQSGGDAMGSNVTSVRKDLETANKPENLNKPAPAGTALAKQQAMTALKKPNPNLVFHTDLFDLVKGHLLDEGYAETEQNALVIMANMSEEWRQSIIENGLNTTGPAKRDPKTGDMVSPTNKPGTTVRVKKNAPYVDFSGPGGIF